MNTFWPTSRLWAGNTSILPATTCGIPTSGQGPLSTLAKPQRFNGASVYAANGSLTCFIFRFARTPLITSWNRITGPSNAGCGQAKIFVRSGELGLRSTATRDSYDPQRPSVLQCRSTAPLHSCSVRGGEPHCRSSTPDVRLDYKLATLPFTPVVRAFLATDYSRG
jgi:hypothetical protein